MDFIRRTIDWPSANVEEGGRPFACLVVKNGEIVAEGVNQVAQTHDPTAHAEIVAIRQAATKLQTENFAGCDFYILAHPCPMCLAAMYYCSPEHVIFVTRREDYLRSITSTTEGTSRSPISMMKSAKPGISGHYP